jgi:hypothetical protein
MPASIYKSSPLGRKTDTDQEIVVAVNDNLGL